jgi:hypothetical protein
VQSVRQGQGVGIDQASLDMLPNSCHSLAAAKHVQVEHGVDSARWVWPLLLRGNL